MPPSELIAKHNFKEVVGKGISYGVVADAVDTQIASSVDYLYDVFPKNFQNGSLIGSGRLNESIPLNEQEDLIVWMRTVALPMFRKLYG
ncbi:hypothetical protein L1987_82839 [Smallanthus sonchifolius]|uniref:Uncharacterized protein n=1 Tax=Smallanthus sonchifolius TaxID=185202 RepID=A0ACB8YBA9_9ASTR|nr:hypothetical protein L1987_82839 [Smallanthus sonchifolius]